MFLIYFTYLSYHYNTLIIITFATVMHIDKIENKLTQSSFIDQNTHLK